MTSLATLGHQHYMLEIHVAASETSIERLPLLEKTTKVLPSCLDCVCIFLAPKPLQQQQFIFHQDETIAKPKGHLITKTSA
jgi:hypothetical protein